MIILGTAIKFFCLLTPFFVLALFLDICKDKSSNDKHKIAIKTSLNILFICLLLLFFGTKLFSILGITLLAFQIGSGIILLLSGISMISSSKVEQRNIVETTDDPSLIPLTLPVTVGPGTVGALFIIGSMKNSSLSLVNTTIGLFISVFCIFLLLYFSDFLMKLLKKNGIILLSKLTGLFLAILATQSILNGIEQFIKGVF